MKAESRETAPREERYSGENIRAAAAHSEVYVNYPTMPGAFPTSPQNAMAAVASKQTPAALSRRIPSTSTSYQKPVPKPFQPSLKDTAYNVLGPLTKTKNSNERLKIAGSPSTSFNSPRRSITAGFWEILGNLVSGRSVSPPSTQDSEARIQADTEALVVKEDDSGSSFIPQTLTDTESPTERKHDPQPGTVTSLPPSYGPKGFHIPPETVKTILEDLKSKKIYWQSSWYRGTDNQKITVHYCKTLERAEDIAKLFLTDEVLGFDIEWKVHARASDGIRKNVSLVQIANEERVALFHIARFKKGDSIEDLVPPTLKTIMESSDITKVGVSVKGDCTRLRKFMGIDARGLLELSHIHKVVQYSKGQSTCLDKRLVSLANQAEEHLGLPLWKGEVRSSDWSQDLNIEQVQYAASDSYAGLQIFYTLDAKRLALDTVPPRPAHAELNLPLRLATGDTYETDDEQSMLSESEQPQASLETETASSSEVDPVEGLSQDLSQTSIEVVKPPSVPRIPKKVAVPSTPPKPEIQAANEWIAQWRATQPTDAKAKAYPAALRAYALWHIQGRDCSSAAALLRDPPLKETSVAAYVLDAIMLENLPFKPERVTDVTTNLPDMLQAKSKRYFQGRQN